MEETPLVRGQMVSDQAYIVDKSMIHELEQKGFGELENEKLFLKQFETLYLLYTKRLVLKKGKKQIDFDFFSNQTWGQKDCTQYPEYGIYFNGNPLQ